MKTKLIFTCITLGALLAPISGFTEDKDANRTDASRYPQSHQRTGDRAQDPRATKYRTPQLLRRDGVFLLYSLT